MIKVESIQETSNAEVVKIEFVQVLSALDKARGFGKPKRHWLTANATDHSFKVGQQFPSSIKMIENDEPQYEGHKPFEKNGKYYTSELV